MRSAVLFVGLFACAPQATDLPLDDAAEDAALELPAEGEWGYAVLVEETGTREVPYQALDGLAIVEGDIVLGTVEDVELRKQHLLLNGAGIESTSLRWPNQVVPYEISSTLPDPDRIHDAIAHWNSSTDITLVQRTNQSDYIRFVESNSSNWDCSSHVGRQGGRQYINLNSGAQPDEIVGMAIAKSDDRVYVWSDDGTVTSGRSDDLDAYRNGYAYSVPPGYAYSDIVAVAIAANDRVYAFYDNGRYSIGNSSDLDRYGSGWSYSLPPGKTHADILGMDFLSSGALYTWFDDGDYTRGVPGDLDSVGTYSWSNATGTTRAEVVGVGLAGSNGLAYVWYDDFSLQGDFVVSRGTRWAQPGDQDVYDYTPRGTCGTRGVIHEIGHAVGLWHEQSRADRNTFVTVQWGNIQSGRDHNFDRKTGSSGRDLDTYDYRSIMHYGPFAFSGNGNATLVTTDPAFQSVIGTARWLSVGDIRAVTELYGYSPGMRSSTSQYSPFDIAGVGIAGSNDHVYTWYRDGFVSRGHSFDLDNRQSRYSYSTAPGRTSWDVVGVAVAKSDDRVYAWYDEGTVSSGTSSDLDRYRAPYSFSLPPGYTIWDIVDIAITTNDRVVTYYDNGRYSVGTTSDLDRYQGPTYVSAAPGLWTSDIRGIDVSRSGQYYVWYDNHDLTIGTANNLDHHRGAW
jgi:hypothetical protein